MKNVRNLIESANQSFMNVFKRADAAKLAELYTEDTKLLPPGSSMTGRAAVQSFWQGDGYGNQRSQARNN